MTQIWRVMMLVGVAVVVLQMSCTSVVEPAGGQWEELGLEGKLVSQLVLIENYLYACAGRDGLYRMKTNIANPQWEYLGLADTAVERSLSLGATDVIFVNNALLVSYAASFRVNKRGIYRSIDEGATWTPSDSGMVTTPEYPTPSQVIRLQKHPSDPRVVLAGTSVSLVYRSDDGGVSWRRVLGTVGASSLNFSIRFSQNEVWVGGETGRFAPYLLHSSDGGQSWSDHITFPPNIGPYTYDNAVYDIAIHPTNSSILYFGMLGIILKTTDKAQSFQRVLGWDETIDPRWRIAMNVHNADELLATGFFLYRTTNGGGTWQKITPPDQRNYLFALAVDWERRVLYTSASDPGNGIYKLHF